MKRIVWVLAAMLGTLPVVAQPAKVSDLLGQVVVTADGELLGRVEDLAVDLQTGDVSFVVVSVGSFLIDDNLIAVHPNALRAADDEQYLVVQGKGLTSARRFGQGSWPRQADVVAMDRPRDVAIAPEQIEAAEAELASRRQAVISDGRRTATLKAGDREVQIETLEPPAGMRDASVKPKKFDAGSRPRSERVDEDFAALDADGDGYLSRREIAPRLGMEDAYGDLDLDGNDGIDQFEYQVLKERG